MGGGKGDRKKKIMKYVPVQSWQLNTGKVISSNGMILNENIGSYVKTP